MAIDFKTKVTSDPKFFVPLELAATSAVVLLSRRIFKGMSLVEMGFLGVTSATLAEGGRRIVVENRKPPADPDPKRPPNSGRLSRSSSQSFIPGVKSGVHSTGEGPPPAPPVPDFSTQIPVLKPLSSYMKVHKEIRAMTIALCDKCEQRRIWLVRFLPVLNKKPAVVPETPDKSKGVDESRVSTPQRNNLSNMLDDLRSNPRFAETRKATTTPPSSKTTTVIPFSHLLNFDVEEIEACCEKLAPLFKQYYEESEERKIAHRNELVSSSRREGESFKDVDDLNAQKMKQEKEKIDKQNASRRQSTHRTLTDSIRNIRLATDGGSDGED